MISRCVLLGAATLLSSTFSALRRLRVGRTVAVMLHLLIDRARRYNAHL